MNTDNIQNKLPTILCDSKIEELMGKDILFKLTDDIDDEGLIGTLKSYDGHRLVIELPGLPCEFLPSEIYEIKELKEI